MAQILEIRKGLIIWVTIEKGGGGEGGKDILRSAQNAALFVDLS